MIKDLPKKLKALRTKYGYSQRKVAEKINVSPAIISSYETGERTPSTEVLLALSYLYNASTDYLLGKQAATPQSVVDVSGLTEKQTALNSLVIYEKLSCCFCFDG